MKTFSLSNGMVLPAVGYGTYKATLQEGDRPICAALETGYRYLDTASFYGNEEAIGSALKKSGLPRQAFQVATKVWKTEMGYENTLRACDRSLQRLGLSEVDLYLIHWPRADLHEENWEEKIRETWRAMEELKRMGKVRAIGVSNLLPHHLQVLGGMTVPVVDQIECHPGYIQLDTVRFCRDRGILVQAWSPISRGRVFQNEQLIALSKKHGVSLARLCLRFLLEEGIMPLPKSADPARMRENLDVFSFSLSEEERRMIREMPECGWSGEHPDRERVYR